MSTLRSANLLLLLLVNAASSLTCGDERCGRWQEDSIDPRLRVLTAGAAVGLEGALAVHAGSGGPSNYTLRDSGTNRELLAVTAVEHAQGCPYVAVGRQGTIIASRDDGATWAAEETPQAAEGRDLHGVDFFCAGEGGEFGVIVGDAGTILVHGAADGPWRAAPSPTARRLNAVVVAADGIATAVGDGGSIIRSTDLGATWETVVTEVKEELITIDVGSVEGRPFGYIAGAMGTLLRSDDGKTWQTVELEVQESLRRVVARRDGSARLLGSQGLYTWSPEQGLLLDHELGSPLLDVVEDEERVVPSLIVLGEEGRLFSFVAKEDCFLGE